jgi:N-acetylmuramoyl-L-alanine amidase
MWARFRALFAPLSRLRLLAPALLAVALVAVAADTGRASGAGVMRVRMGGDHQSTRVVIELDRSAKGRLVSDIADLSRVVLSLPGVDVDGDLQGRGSGLVRDWSVDRSSGGARVALNLSGRASVKRRFLLPPGDGVAVYRYVMDLEAAVAAAPPAPLNVTQPSRPVIAPDYAEPPTMGDSWSGAHTQRKSGKRVIVIDPGHGGKDPGASGAAALEKGITLAAAKSLKQKLERTGRYSVILTRSSDVYIPLETRVSVARRAEADLFISLHADAGPDRVIRGASVYTLSERGADRAARKVLSRDDWFRDVSLPGRDPAVNRILLDLTQRATKNRSASFARTLLARLEGRTPLLNRSHRDAGFMVLLAPDVPAVLLEMGFITNAQDEAALSDPGRRNRILDGVAGAVDEYFQGEAHPSTLAALP